MTIATARDVVQKLWSYCNVLRDDGLSYPDYVEQLTYLLFLKMADEGSDDRTSDQLVIPEDLGWKSFSDLDGQELARRYGSTLSTLSDSPGMLGLIFADARNKIRDPGKLTLLVRDLIGSETWSSGDFDVKGAAYEGLLEKNAQDTKSGAGQYFTPRPIIDAIIACVRPSPGETVCDPACGTAGFLVSAHRYILETWRDLSEEELSHLRLHALHGADIVPEVVRLAAMNLFLHGIGPIGLEAATPVTTADSLRDASSEQFDVIVTNPPFGTKSSTRLVTSRDSSSMRRNVLRPDLWVSTSNKELNFLQHVASALRSGGRAAIVVPDGVLQASGAAEHIRRRLLLEYDVHTLLRLPPSLFYAQGVNANVLFFDKPADSRPLANGRQLWVYDLRGEKKFSMSNLFERRDIADFETAFCPADRHRRNTSGGDLARRNRWRPFPIEDLLATPHVDLGISWHKEGDSRQTSADSSALIASIVSELQAALGEAEALMKSDD